VICGIPGYDLMVEEAGGSTFQKMSDNTVDENERLLRLYRKLKTMATHSSATARQQTSHVNRTTRTATIMNALKQRAQETLNDPSLDDQSRATLHHALETYDPWLAELVRRADAPD